MTVRPKAATNESGGGAGFSHLSAEGRATMVDVSGKPVTRRVAEASCRVVISPATIARLASLPKGDALVVAKLAGIQAAKRTDQWIPLAHPLPLDQVEVVLDVGSSSVRIRSSVICTARTGAEMEALVACSAAALALYDMVKAVDKAVVITDLQLDRKTGGGSGDFARADLTSPQGAEDKW